MPTEREERPVLLVASGGGHLTQLADLAERFTPQRPRHWVTFDTDQSRTLLAGEANVDFVINVPPRGYLQLLRVLPSAWSILRRVRPALVVSTGSAVALGFLPLARLMRIDTHYIESATRSEGPSMTGGILARVPGIGLHTQHRARAEGRWTYVGSVFEGYERVEQSPRPIERVVVTVGTMENYGFRRLVERLTEILPPTAQVLWQTGATDTSDLPIDGRVAVPSDELEHGIRTADVVIAHAGTGTALTCMQLGKRPILVPRRPEHDEHVDDHQSQTAEFLESLGLAAVHQAHELSLEDLVEATRWAVERSTAPAPISLSAE